MADQTKLRKRLEALLKLPGNQICADCKKRGPRWASANLGIFMCIECSGIHRNLGVHISFVRSINLDSWTVPQVEFMEEWGNARANAYYEAKVPAHVQCPKEGDPVRVIERFIRDKYEHKRFIADSVPEPDQLRQLEAAAHAGGNGNAAQPSRRALRQQQQQRQQLPQASAIPSAATPASVPQEVVKSAPPQPATFASQSSQVVADSSPSLIDFLDDNTPPPPAPHPLTSGHTPDMFGQNQGEQGFSAFTATPGGEFGASGDFGAFTSSPAPEQQFQAQQGYPQAQPPPQQQPAKPQASADAILSLFSYGGGPGQQQGGMGGIGAMGGMGAMGGIAAHPHNMHQMMQMPNQQQQHFQHQHQQYPQQQKFPYQPYPQQYQQYQQQQHHQQQYHQQQQCHHDHQQQYHQQQHSHQQQPHQQPTSSFPMHGGWP